MKKKIITTLVSLATISMLGYNTLYPSINNNNFTNQVEVKKNIVHTSKIIKREKPKIGLEEKLNREIKDKYFPHNSQLSFSLPNFGRKHCIPTAAANLLLYLDFFYPDLIDESKPNHERDLIHKLGTIMKTSAKTGTKKNVFRKKFNSYLEKKGYLSNLDYRFINKYGQYHYRLDIGWMKRNTSRMNNVILDLYYFKKNKYRNKKTGQINWENQLTGHFINLLYINKKYNFNNYQIKIRDPFSIGIDKDYATIKKDKYNIWRVYGLLLTGNKDVIIGGAMSYRLIPKRKKLVKK
jgi:hypothetical protein